MLSRGRAAWIVVCAVPTRTVVACKPRGWKINAVRAIIEVIRWRVAQMRVYTTHLFLLYNVTNA